MLAAFRQWLFGVSPTSEKDLEGVKESSDEELLGNPNYLHNNPVLLYYGDSDNRGVVVFALQDIPVNVPMVSDKGTKVMRMARESVVVGKQEFTLTRDALREEDEMRKRQQEDKEQQRKYQMALENESRAREVGGDVKLAAEAGPSKTDDELKKLEEELRRKEEEFKKEEARKKEEQRRKEEERPKEEEKRKEETRKKEEERQKEETRKKEEERQKEEARKKEEERQKEEAKKNEERRKEEERQKEEAKEAEEKRQKEEARRQQEEERKEEERRIREAKQIEEERAKEEKRKEEEREKDERAKEELRQQREKESAKETSEIVEEIMADNTEDSEERKKDEVVRKREGEDEEEAEVKDGERPLRKRKVDTDEEKQHLVHLTLMRAQFQGRKLPTKPVSEFPNLKREPSPKLVEEREAEEEVSTPQEEEAPKKKAFSPPRGGMALPMFDPSAAKSTLKRTPTKTEESQEGGEEVSPRKPAVPFGAKAAFALPGMGIPDLGAVKLKKAAKPTNDQPSTNSDEPTVQQVDFRNLLKKSPTKTENP